MRLAVLLLLTACADHDVTPTPVARPAAAPTIEESIDGLTLFQRLRDDAGPVPGLPGAKLTWTKDANHCGGVAVTASHATASEPINDVFAIRFPTDLDFTPTNQARENAALVKFDAWVQQTMTTGKDARAFYEERVKTASGRDRIIAAARLVQLQRYIASVFVRAEIPLDVRSGEYAAEKTEAFCDRLAEVAEPIVIVSEGAAKACAQLAAGYPPDWWTPVCSLRPPVVSASASPSTSR